MEARLKELAIKFRKNQLTDTEVAEFANLMNFNPFYVKNPSSWLIMLSMLQKVYWKINKDTNIKRLPENWIDCFEI